MNVSLGSVRRIKPSHVPQLGPVTSSNIPPSWDIRSCATYLRIIDADAIATKIKP